MTDTASPSARRQPRDRWAGVSVEPPTKASVVAYGVGALLMIGVGAALGPLAGVAAVAAVGAGIVIMSRPVLGAYILVACAATLSGLQRGLPVPGFRLTELLIVGIATVVLITARHTPRWGTFDWIAFGYVIANAFLVWLNVVRHGDALTADTWGTLIGPLQYFLLYRTLLTVIREEHQRAFALRLLLLASLPVSFLTLLQQLNIGPARQLVGTLAGQDVELGYQSTIQGVARATGPFPHWHNLAGFLLLVLLLGVSLLHEPAQRVLRRPLLIAVLVPAFIALVQTASIAPIVGLLVGSILVAMYVGQTHRMLVWVGVGTIIATVAAWPVLQDRFHQQYAASAVTEDQTLLPQTIAFRVAVWKTEFIPVIRDNLLIGYGPNLPPRLFFNFTESIYITFLLRGGIILLIFYLALMGALALRSRRVANSNEVGRRSVARALFAAVVLLLAIDTIANYFIDSGPAPMLWTLAGLIGYDWTRERGKPDRPRLIRVRRDGWIPPSKTGSRKAVDRTLQPPDPQTL